MREIGFQGQTCFASENSGLNNFDRFSQGSFFQSAMQPANQALPAVELSGWPAGNCTDKMSKPIERK